MKTKTIEKNINLFFSLTPTEFVNLSINEFKLIIGSLPENYIFFGMAISLMDDLIEKEAYEHCAILRDYIQLLNEKNPQ